MRRLGSVVGLFALVSVVAAAPASAQRRGGYQTGSSAVD